VSLALWAPKSETVKIAGVSVAHPRNYWDLILDRAVPAGQAAEYKREFARIEEELFRRSRAAAQGKARIVFWSEGNLFVYEDQLAEFLERAGKFARAQGIYFAPSLQVLRYGSPLNDNRSVMIGPDGKIAYTYFKAVSLYPTVSDRVIRFVDTPYGRIGSAICFDLDFPPYLRQAGRKRIDILLAPAFDTRGASPFHTFVGLVRGIENGFSVFRQVNEGTSMAIDPQGRVLARQDFFKSPDGVLYADVPTRGGRRPYTYAGDWLAWASGLFVAAALSWELWRRITGRSSARR
jgi:apolipoprotein N-acyltransferase